jgi:hypothetical protein
MCESGRPRDRELRTLAPPAVWPFGNYARMEMEIARLHAAGRKETRMPPQDAIDEGLKRAEAAPAPPRSDVCEERDDDEEAGP